MGTLDDARRIASVDASGMLDVLAKYGDMLEDAWRLGEGAAAKAQAADAKGLVFTGMGGSGIGGELCAAYFRDSFRVPVAVSKDYALPHWAGEGTLVVCTSYSGETEETLSAFVEAAKRGASLLALSSGGRLEKFSKDVGATHVRVPSGLQPRAALPYLFTPLLRLVSESGLAGNGARGGEELGEAVQVARQGVESLRKTVPEDANEAKRVASFVGTRVPVVYAAGHLEPVARRWKTQFNENAKAIAFADALPEANHNDLVAWSGDRGAARRCCALFLREPGEPGPVAERFAFTESVVGQMTETMRIEAPDAGKLARMVHLLMVGDFASAYLAVLRGVDPTPVTIIGQLKQNLARLGKVAALERELRTLLRKEKRE